ncbi:unnamed protein product [Toxocara canis]|uniref:INVERT_DEFENSINS domain-containing protein n=1 Tax=Toxocara canis TaxID=6265 RepID=A0A183UUW9_TOXCA|nr:unnamed protein product [Toxocara canis]
MCPRSVHSRRTLIKKNEARCLSLRSTGGVRGAAIILIAARRVDLKRSVVNSAFAFFPDRRTASSLPGDDLRSREEHERFPRLVPSIACDVICERIRCNNAKGFGNCVLGCGDDAVRFVEACRFRLCRCKSS